MKNKSKTNWRLHFAIANTYHRTAELASSMGNIAFSLFFPTYLPLNHGFKLLKTQTQTRPEIEALEKNQQEKKELFFIEQDEFHDPTEEEKKKPNN